AFGGQFFGNIELQDFVRYKMQGNLRGITLRAVARVAGEPQLPYDGSVSGPVEASGNIKAPSFLEGLTANLRLAIAPGKHGIPVSGRLVANYSGATGNVKVQNSFIALPHTRFTLNGTVGNRLDVTVSTSDLNDLLAAAGPNINPHVKLNDRQAS